MTFAFRHALTLYLAVVLVIDFVLASPQSSGVGSADTDPMDEPAREAVVQKPVTVNVVDATPLVTPPPVAPLRTRVVVVHNNMVPVPIECFQSPDAGTCSKDLARIYYDHETRTCKPFSYTGCGGNANRFQSIKNCYRICHPYRYKIRPKVADKKPAVANSRRHVRIQYPDAGMTGGCSGSGPRSMYGQPRIGPPGNPAAYPGYPPVYPGGISPRYTGGPPPPGPYGAYPGAYPRNSPSSMSQPIVERSLVNSGGAPVVQEKLIGESAQPLPPENSGTLYGR